MIAREPTDELKAGLDNLIEWALSRQRLFYKLSQVFNNSINHRAKLTRLSQGWKNRCVMLKDYHVQHSFSLGSYKNEVVRKCLEDQENAISIMQALFTLPQIAPSITTKQPVKHSAATDTASINYRLRALRTPDVDISLLSDFDPDLKNPKFDMSVGKKDCCENLPNVKKLLEQTAVKLDYLISALNTSLNAFISSPEHTEVQEHYHKLQETMSTRQKIT